MYFAVLAIHIVGAILSGIVAVTAVGLLAKAKSEFYSTVARTLAYLGAFEVLTGTLLAALSNTVSAASLCGNIAVYLAVIASIESVFYVRMKQGEFRFPMLQTISPVGASLFVLLTGLVLGF